METSVSVIMPVYNYARYLKEALDSVMAQSVKPHEIIVVDDCSTDNPKEICDLYPVIYIKHDKNRGLAAARNTGIRHATGTYCFSFDADDILRPDAIKEHVKLAAPNTIVTCGLMAFGADTYTARPEKATLELLMKRNCIYSNSLFPKALWEKVGGFDESETMRLGLEDWEAWIRMAGAGANFVTSDYIALLWRRHPQAMSTASANPNWEKITSYIFNKNKHLLP